jgi:hypothetical protein
MDAKPAVQSRRGAAAALSSAVGAAVDKSLHKLTQVDISLPRERFEKTNPPGRPNPASPTPRRKLAATSLSPRQLAAVRLFAAGTSVAEVAGRLKVSRQSLWKWRRQPAFAEEIRRVHQQLVAVDVAQRREFRQQQHERFQRRDDALIERLLRGK